MSTTQGCNDDRDVVDRFKEALEQRVGPERFDIWFARIRFEYRDPQSPGSDPPEHAAVANQGPVANPCRTEASDPSDSGEPDSGEPDSGKPSRGETTRGRARGKLAAIAQGQFAADRLSKHFLSAMRGAAATVFGGDTAVVIEVDDTPAQQVPLPFCDAPTEGAGGADSTAAQSTDLQSTGVQRVDGPAVVPSRPASISRRATKGHGGSGAKSLRSILSDGTNSRRPGAPRQGTGRPSTAAEHARQLSLPELEAGLSAASATGPAGRPAQSAPQATQPSPSGQPCKSGHTWENFVAGSCNELARTACQMAIQNPSVASPLVLWGPPGCGKTHLLSAVAGKLRGLHRLRRVVLMSAEEFTNDFIKALNTNCLPAFRLRFRDVDALLIDDIQFFVDKKATIRELHHTIESLAEFGKPLVFAGTKAPTEIQGLGSELSGRLASGLVCQVQSLDVATRMELLQRYADQRCSFAWPRETLKEIAELADGEGRVLSGIVNLVALLQRMLGEMPTMQQIRQHGSHLLRSSGVPITLSAIERAVEKVFELDSKSLQSKSQTKAITEPRMLAMFLSREMTSSAFSEIGGHFGGRSHSTAILATQRVRQWIDGGKAIGRGRAALSTDEAIRRIESMLKTG
ncbi:DnaA/Hda family protein [Roseiconus nitratireducens]|nr:DnaA/Hda family protein [Roseiconus nitratireducens]